MTDTEFVPQRPKLPEELFNLIIGQSRDNRASLQKLSLVCRTFCWHARRHLFRSIRVTCEQAGTLNRYEPFQEYNEFRLSPHHGKLMIDEFVRLCESPHSTWRPRVVKELKLSPRFCDPYTSLLLLAASDHPKTFLDPITTKLDIPRTRDIFRGLVSLQLSCGEFNNRNHIGITPSEFISTTFPSIRRLSLKSTRLSAVDVWNIFLSMPLLEEFEWIGGLAHYWPLSVPLVNAGQQLPNLRSFSYEGGQHISLQNLMPVLSRLPKSHLRRYNFRRLSSRDDFPAISTLMTLAGSDGPANQQWSFAFSPNASNHRPYNPERSMVDRDFIVEHLCLSRNSRISELIFVEKNGWLIVPEVLERFANMSLSKSNLRSIVLPSFRVDDWFEGGYIWLPLGKIDEILDRDAFTGFQALHFRSSRSPGSNVEVGTHPNRPSDENARNARWGGYESLLENIEKVLVSRAVKRGVWKLHTRVL